MQFINFNKVNKAKTNKMIPSRPMANKKENTNKNEYLEDIQ